MWSSCIEPLTSLEMLTVLHEPPKNVCVECPPGRYVGWLKRGLLGLLCQQGLGGDGGLLGGIPPGFPSHPPLRPQPLQVEDILMGW